MSVMVVCVCAWSGMVFIAITLDETSILVAVHFSDEKKITSFVIRAEPLGGTTLASANNVLCLLTFA